MQNYSSYVMAALARYESPVVPAADEEAGKAQLTRAAAWDIYQVNPNIGLKAKTSGNQVAGLTVDTILDRTTGEVVDIATSKPEPPGYVTILTGWYPYAPNPAEIVNWVQPTADLAAMPGPMAPIDTPTPEPEPEPEPDDDTEILIALDDLKAQMADLSQQVANGFADTRAAIQHNEDRFNQVVEDFEATAKKIGVLYLVLRQRGEPVPE